MRARVAALAAVAVTAVGVVLAGCGGSSSPSDANGSAASTAGASSVATLAAPVAGALTTGLDRVAAELRGAGQGADVPAAAGRARTEVDALLDAARAQGRAARGRPPSILVLRLRRLDDVLARAAATGSDLSAAQRALVAGEAERLAVDLRTRVQRSEPGLAAAGPHRAAPSAPAPFRQADAVSAALFRARWALAAGDPAGATQAAEEARAAAGANADASLAAAVPGLDADLARAVRAARRGDAVALAAARGRVEARIAVAAAQRAARAAAAGHGAAAMRWASVRDLGPTTAAPAVRDDAARAAAALDAGRLSPAATALAICRDTIDGFQRRAVALVQQAGLAAYHGREADRAQAAALAARYWSVLEPEYARRLSEPPATAVRAAFAGLAAPTADREGWRLDADVSAAGAALTQFTAAPPTAAERDARAAKLVSLTSLTTSQLCDRNAPARTKGGDIGEGSIGPSAITRLINDVRPTLTSADAARLASVARDLQGLPQAAGILGEEGAPPSPTVPAEAKRLCDRVRDGVAAVFPGQWRRLGGDEDLDRVEAALAKMDAAAAQGRWDEADRQRRAAYAIFELGPEPRLRAFAPDLAVRIEGLFWAAAPDGPNLVDVLSQRSSARVVHERRMATVAAIEQARVALNRSRSNGAVLVDSTIMVFREGLEAALILAALAATFAVGGSAWRRPLVAGMALALPATVITWFATGAAVKSLSGYALTVEAILDVAALVVLVVIMAWFFQRFCWTRFVAKQHARHRRLTALRGVAGPSLALGLLGFTVLYREGFETVIYLQALRLDAGTGTVLQGVALGLALTAILALLMLRLRRRLPYRTIVVVTAAVIGVLTVVMAGQAARGAQAAGWLAIDPIDVDFPAWTGQWLGVYPATQTLVAQLLAAIGVVALGLAVRARRERRVSRQVARARARKLEQRTRARGTA